MEDIREAGGRALISRCELDRHCDVVLARAYSLLSLSQAQLASCKDGVQDQSMEGSKLQEVTS